MLRDRLFEHPKLIMAIAFLLMLFGAVMPFLMVIKLVESTFFLNFLSYGSSVFGLILGIVSVAASHIKQKRKDEREDRYR